MTAALLLLEGTADQESALLDPLGMAQSTLTDQRAARR
jgi:hypothetical protein